MLVGLKNKKNNNEQIYIAPQDRNFRGAGARQRVSEQGKKRKPGKRGMSSLVLKWSVQLYHAVDNYASCIQGLQANQQRQRHST